MKIYDFLIRQVKIKNIKDALLLLKLIVMIVVAHEVYYVICRICCLASGSQIIEDLIFYLLKQIILIFIIYFIYRIFKRSKRKGTVGRTVTIFILFCALAYWFNGSIMGILYFDGPYLGKVVDADTGEPISGANVMGRWEFDCFVLIQSTFEFADVRETVTDKDGQFILPPARKVLFWPSSRIYLENLYVYKTGYDSHPPQMQRAWSSIEKEQWQIKLAKMDTKYKNGEDPVRDYFMTFYKFAKEIKPYKPTIIRLNKTSSIKEQNNVKSGFPNDGFNCERFKIKLFAKSVEDNPTNTEKKPIQTVIPAGKLKSIEVEISKEAIEKDPIERKRRLYSPKY